MTDKQTINDFNREELSDILTFLYLHGVEIVDKQAQMTAFVNGTVSQHMKAANKAKYNRFGNVAGIIFAAAGTVGFKQGFFYGLALMVTTFVIGQMSARGLLWWNRFLTEKQKPALKKTEKGNILGKKKTAQVTQAGLEAAHASSQYQTYLQELQALEGNGTFTYFMNLIPKNFANLVDFSGMLVLLEDFRATNFQEAANLWRSEQHQQRVVQRQQQMAKELEKQSKQAESLRRQVAGLKKVKEDGLVKAQRTIREVEKANDKLSKLL